MYEDLPARIARLEALVESLQARDSMFGDVMAEALSNLQTAIVKIAESQALALALLCEELIARKTVSRTALLEAIDSQRAKLGEDETSRTMTTTLETLASVLRTQNVS